MSAEIRPLGRTDILIRPVAMGCWPIAGMTSLDVTRTHSLATLHAALDAGVNHLDTAFCYGADGESEKLIGEAIAGRRDEVMIATKGGITIDADLQRHVDGRPDTLRRQCEMSLQRLGTDRVELFYLHAPDPKTPIAESAGAIAKLMDEGKVLAAGGSNLSLAQMQEFHAVCPLSAIQPPYNMLMRDIEAEIVPWCIQQQVSILVYWPLMKGLLAGKLPRDHVFDAKDGRAKYPMFQGDEWQKNQDLMDELKEIAASVGKTVGQLAIGWTIRQPGITAALCGAKRPEQIEETAGAMGWELPDEKWGEIDAALAHRGAPVTRWAI